MKHLRVFPIFGVALIVASFGFSSAVAQDAKIGDLTITEGWARESVGPARTGAAYLEVRNNGRAPVSVTGASSDTARVVELHQTIKDGDVMRMRRVDSLDIAPGETIVLQPGGHHLMFMGLKEPFRPGMSVGVTLSLSDGRTVAVDLPVRPLGGGAHGHAEHDDEHRHEHEKSHGHTGDKPHDHNEKDHQE
jgi:copper(I)-binding protein